MGGLKRNPADAAIVELLIRLAASLGREVIAGGIETAQQSDFLQRHGCHLGQGYLLARPSSGERVAALLLRS